MSHAFCDFGAFCCLYQRSMTTRDHREPLHFSRFGHQTGPSTIPWSSCRPLPTPPSLVHRLRILHPETPSTCHFISRHRHLPSSSPIASNPPNTPHSSRFHPPSSHIIVPFYSSSDRALFLQTRQCKPSIIPIQPIHCSLSSSILIPLTAESRIPTISSR